MPITCKACSICRDSVEQALERVNLPYTHSQSGSTSIYTVNITSPTTWNPNSLAKLCWNKLEFPYHQAKRSGNTIQCTNV
ncbi:hypothetical protein C8A03DRAFT_18179 [Achaetomium macrosporum]|uniref:Uncharacterized protein n=1 Tax=Achaetomium macrosporum TaxID=79813 RepID=A0AAN7C427_9PEZI|nr:hypothetical protein C8A03DRAFT_18179 [Achaetomium macrosporum]